MADITLTVTQACEFIPGSTITDSDLDAAAEEIERRTGYTVTEHSDEATDGIRQVPEAQVKRAWAIVAARFNYLTATAVDPVLDVSDADSRFTISAVELDRMRGDLLHGLPRTLLQTQAARWTRV